MNLGGGRAGGWGTGTSIHVQRYSQFCKLVMHPHKDNTQDIQDTIAQTSHESNQ